jgi:hypothetical protein
MPNQIATPTVPVVAQRRGHPRLGYSPAPTRLTVARAQPVVDTRPRSKTV